MHIITWTDTSVKETISVLKKGGIVVFPTDTVYGLLCDATNEQAILKLLKIKNRPVGKPISVFVNDFFMMKKLVEVTLSQEALLQDLLPGPFTIVLPSKKVVCYLLESERETLGIRIPNYQKIIDLVTLFNHPLTATSANTSGYPPFYSTTSFLKTVSRKNKALIDLVVDAGELPKNKPSTVLDFSKSQIKTLRQGDLHFNNTKILITSSEEETKNTAGTLLREVLKKKEDKPIVFILKGEMGVGKTIFAKGIAKILGINNIISPTYVIYYEYKTDHPLINLFIHCDLYNIEEQNEFQHLGLESYFKKGTVLCFEWGEKSKFLLDRYKDAHIIVINMSHKGDIKRQLTIEES